MTAARLLTEHTLRREVVDVARSLHERGWVANHDGNVTAKAAPGRIVATSTALSKRLVDSINLIVVDERGRVVGGRHRPFGELAMHLAVYAARDDVRAVVHAHPPHATALATTGGSLECFLPEAVVSLGANVPLVPLAPPGPKAVDALAPFLEAHDVVLLESHGVLGWGPDPETAFLRLELVEHLARIRALALPEGGPRRLSRELIAELLVARTRAGLGPEARRATKP